MDMSNLFYYEPYYHDYERFFDEAFNIPTQFRTTFGQPLVRRGEGGEGTVRHLRPRMDLHEDAEKNLVTATFEIPGVPKENLDINVQNGRLIITAENKQASEYGDHGWTIRERRYGKYSRTLQLPDGVKEEAIKANVDNGLLIITYPKTTPEQAPKKITIV